MQSFKVTPIPHREVGAFDYVDVAELTCRSCEREGDKEYPGQFVVAITPRVGRVLFCPYCQEASVIPKKARWSA